MVSAVDIVPAILKRYILCNKCLARQSSRKISNVKTKDKCYICNGLMERVDELLDLVLAALEEYEYKTFLIGAVLPADILEREDEIRARFKIKGIENLKSQLTRELGKRLSKKTSKRVDYTKPDVTISVDLVKEEAVVRSKAIFLFGRYVKRKRGLNQKQERCNLCKGKGCSQCDNTGLSGFNSVEGVIVRKLINAFKCESAKFAWVGGEDKDSLVLNGGRPFFVKVINPKRRFAKPRGIAKDGIQVKFLKRVQRLPDKPLKFRMRVRLQVECECEIDKTSLKKLNDLNNTNIVFSGKRGKEVSRSIYRINAKASKNVIKILMDVDGGLTIKQFVSGDGMTPTISQIVGCEARCKHFDILHVKFTDR